MVTPPRTVRLEDRVFLPWGLPGKGPSGWLGRNDAGDVGNHVVAGSDSELGEVPAGVEVIAAAEGPGRRFYNIGLGVVLIAAAESEVGTGGCLLGLRYDSEVREIGAIEHHSVLKLKYSTQVPGEGLALLEGEEAAVIDQPTLAANSQSCQALAEEVAVLGL